jgi:hypothetical protein
MKSILQISVVAAIAAVAFSPVTASAQAKCTEGVAATGECVDPGIAVSSRQAAVILTQPKISYTAYPILPTGDVDYRYPNQLNPNQQMPSPTGTPVNNGNP